MKTSLAFVVGTVSLLSASIASAENGAMMNGGGWMGTYGGMGGYGGIWGPILLVILVAGVVMWFVKQRGK